MSTDGILFEHINLIVGVEEEFGFKIPMGKGRNHEECWRNGRYHFGDGKSSMSITSFYYLVLITLGVFNLLCDSTKKAQWVILLCLSLVFTILRQHHIQLDI